MRCRTLGNTELSISEIGFGAWGAGGAQWRGVPSEECAAAIRCGLELGINFIDTALAYGDGHSERLIGKVLKTWPRPAVIATKVPPLNRIWPAPDTARIDEVFPWQHVIHSTEESLRNLGVERIDLQQLHVWNSHWTQKEEWRRAFEALKQSGKVRFVGISLTEHDPDSGIALVESGLVDALQVIYNIFDPSAADHLFPLAMQKGVGIIARVPLDEGGLTATIDESTKFEKDDFRATYFRGERRRQLAKHVDALQHDLRNTSGSLPEIAIRFCLSHPVVTSVIPGMRRRRHVESNVRAAATGPLPSETLDLLKRHAWKRSFYS